MAERLWDGLKAEGEFMDEHKDCEIRYGFTGDDLALFCHMHKVALQNPTFIAMSMLGRKE